MRKVDHNNAVEVLLICVAVISVLIGYSKIIVRHDFTIFTSEEDGGGGGAYMEGFGI